MATYVAFLRGINVGGNRKVPMARLRLVHERLGHTDVRTYIQSGNVVFDADTTDVGSLRHEVEAAIAAEFGFDVDVVLRTSGEVAGAVEASPFPESDDPARIGIVFLADEPDGDLVDLAAEAAGPGEEVVAVGRELHLRCPNGFGRSPLAAALAKPRTGDVATMRNLKTARRVLELVQQ